MSGPPRRPRRPARAAQVVRVGRVTPHMIRIVLGGPALDDFTVESYTDTYIKILFTVPGFTYEEPLDLQRIRTWMPPEAWPRMRTYTVRHWDPAAGELTVDVVDHGDAGLAGPWAARLAVGDTVHFVGPAGRYTPTADAEWFLLAGDESALPAIAVTLAALPVGARAHAFIEVASAVEEQTLTTPADASVTWLHRGSAPVGEALVGAVSSWAAPPGAGEAFVHGEAGFVKELRRLLMVDRGLPRDRVSASGYWRLGQDEDAWEKAKREFDLP